MSKGKAAVTVLGCRVNQAEAGGVRALLAGAGYEIVEPGDVADVYVIHTCTVTKQSDRKSRQAVRRALRANPDAKVVVSGCYAQTSPRELAEMEGVDLIVGTGNLHRIVELLEEVHGTGKPLQRVEEMQSDGPFEDLPAARSSRTRAFVKVQEGCQQFCTYCIIPYARGRLRSKPREAALKEIRNLIREGYQEVVLTGIKLGAYGRDLNPPSTLAELVSKTSQLPGMNRLRLSSVDPNDFDPALIDVLTGSAAVCPHFHIPLQSGDDGILERMGRRYTTTQYADIVSSLRAENDQTSITTDVMVGFPGETEKHFERTRRFLEDVGFMDTHIFKYSPRKGTPAAEFPDQVPPEIKDERSAKLHRLSFELYRKFSSSFIGKTLEVLVEQAASGLQQGHAPNYLLVRLACRNDLRGRVVPVRVEGVENKTVLGKGIVDENTEVMPDQKT